MSAPISKPPGSASASALRIFSILAVISGVIGAVNATGYVSDFYLYSGVVTCIVFAGFSAVVSHLNRIAWLLEKPIPLSVPEYFYEVGGEVRGPVMIHQLAAMRALPHEGRQITGETLVCVVGKKSWVRLADLNP